MIEVEKLKQKILDLAIRGKLVPQDPNDEPASVLIEKIKKEKEQLVKEGKIKASKNDSYIYKGSDNCYYENNEIIEFIPPIETNENIIWLRGESFIYKMESIKPTNKEFEYIDIEAINNKCNRIENPKKLLSSKAPSRATRKIYSSSTLFSMVRPYLRNIAYVGEQYKHCIASTGFYVCTPLPFVDEKYLYYLLTSDYVVSSLNYYMKGDNSPSITTGDLENLLYPIPSLEYQKRVVQLIEKIHPLIAKIENYNNQLKLLIDKAKKQLLEDIFGENSSYKSYYLNREKTNLSKLIDKDKIGDGDWILSSNMDNDGEYNLVQLKHIGNGKYIDKTYQKISSSFFKENNCTEIHENDILINRIISKGLNVCMLPNINSKCITSVDVCWIAPDAGKYNQKYLMYLLLSPSFQKEVKLLSSGSTRMRISKSKLIKIEFLYHRDVSIQKQIVEDIENKFKLLDQICS